MSITSGLAQVARATGLRSPAAAQSRVGLHTPADVHFGMTGHVENQRLGALQKAREEHPERFGLRRVPKNLQLPDAAWINEPVKQEEKEKMPAA